MRQRRRRRRAPPKWEKNWRNPDMLVLRTYFDVFGNKVTKDMTPAESSDLSAEGVEAGMPDYRTDPSYWWARDAKKKRRAAQK